MVAGGMEGGSVVVNRVQSGGGGGRMYKIIGQVTAIEGGWGGKL